MQDYKQLESIINRNDCVAFQSYLQHNPSFNVNYILPDGDPLVIRAIRVRGKSITRQLLKLGADVSIRDTAGESGFKLLLGSMLADVGLVVRSANCSPMRPGLKGGNRNDRRQSTSSIATKRTATNH